MIEIRRADLLSETSQVLIAALNAELRARYPEDGVSYFRLDAEEVRPGRGAFLVAYDGPNPVGCGAVRLIEPATAEIKRMYVRPDARGRGFGRSVLTALEAEARAIGVTRLLLETGTRQPEAIALYSRSGFILTEPFGEYRASPLNVFYEKRL